MAWLSARCRLPDQGRSALFPGEYEKSVCLAQQFCFSELFIRVFSPAGSRNDILGHSTL